MARPRKSSSRVTLVLVGLASLAAGCNRVPPETKRDVYASREDCLADWGHKPEDCTPATDRPRHGGGGFFFYGPMYNAMSGWGSSSGWTGSGSRPGSHAVASTSPSHGSVSRGGFGSSAHSSSSS